MPISLPGMAPSRSALPSCVIGRGRALLAKVVDAVFEETEAWRIWLGVFPENIRARQAYEAVGFRAEGIARDCAFIGDVHRDEFMMALLRPEWEARRKPTLDSMR